MAAGPLRIDDAATNGTLARRTSHGDDNVRLDVTLAFDAPSDPAPITEAALAAFIPEVIAASEKLLRGEGDCLDKGVKMLGWQDLPQELAGRHLSHIEERAEALRSRIDAYVSLGIGGSYLGIEATFRALSHAFHNQLSRAKRGGSPEVYFLGQNLDPDLYRDTLDALEGKRVGIHVISKSGTTTETAVAFRLMRRLLETNYGKQAARDLIYVTTDADKGALRQQVEQHGYSSFVVPNDIGGRFSILSDVGLVGLAVAGVDIEAFLNGFRVMRERCITSDFWSNPALVHAAIRTLAWRNGKKIEVVATNSQALTGVTRWMEQLFPESEGHNGRGLWVSSSMYSEKLHANGQMVQEGERNLIETFLALENADSTVAIPPEQDDGDGLNFLSDKRGTMNDLNRVVVDGPALAHYEGGVPVMKVLLPRRSAHVLGQLYYMMERSVAVSGYLLGNNPFIQPGVEAYKRAMFAMAGKPGYEDEARRIREHLATLNPRLVG